MAVRLGVHVSIAGGVEKAVSRAEQLDCSAMQIFSRNPRGWQAGPLNPRNVMAFRRAAEKTRIRPIVVHTPYLVNLASGDAALHRRSIQAVAADVRRAEQLGAQFVVTHVGSAKGKDKSFGLDQIVRALKAVLEEDFAISILLENSAGMGDSLGGLLTELQEIIERLGKDQRLGVCFDSCHGYAAGYDFSSREKTSALGQEMNQTIGLDRLALLHLNDSAGLLGSHVDRHAHIGQGKIGLQGFRSLLGHSVLRRLPMILETPKKSPQDDVRNLSRIRGLLFPGTGKAG